MAVLVNAGNREFYPLRNVGAVVTNPLKILANHQKIQRIFTLGRLGCNHLDDSVLDLGEIIVHHIIVGITLRASSRFLLFWIRKDSSLCIHHIDVM